MSEPIGVLVVDDQGVIRAGLRMIIDHEPDLHVVGEAADGEQAVAMAQALHPDVVLMDVRMPRMDGLEATRLITGGVAANGGGPGVPRNGAAVLVLTTFDDEEYVLGAVRAGASGFLLKDAGPDVLVQGVRTVHRGDALVDPSVTRTLLAHCLALEADDLAGVPVGAPRAGVTGAGGAGGAGAKGAWGPLLASLSEREREILAGVAQGLSNRELAAQLFLSETTVKTHVSAMLAKLGLRSRVQAVIVAYETGVVAPGTNPGPAAWS